MEINDPQMMFDEDITTKESLWVRRMMKLAKLVAENSPCVRRKVGCVITNKDHRVISCGYNGNIPGHPHCTKETCYRYQNNIPSGQMIDRCMSIHGEQNAIVSAAIQGVSLVDSLIYVTTMPCITCMKMLLSVKPKWIFFESDYDIKNIQWILDNEKYCHIVQVSIDEYDNFSWHYLTKKDAYKNNPTYVTRSQVC
nr:MAG TPA: deoxycytidylate deaminase [Bacteriophage sp.]